MRCLNLDSEICMDLSSVEREELLEFFWNSAGCPHGEKETPSGGWRGRERTVQNLEFARYCEMERQARKATYMVMSFPSALLPNQKPPERHFWACPFLRVAKDGELLPRMCGSWTR